MTKIALKVNQVNLLEPLPYEAPEEIPAEEIEVVDETIENSVKANISVEKTENIGVSVSHTTRAKREGEMDGVDYNFVDKATFEQMVEEAAFLEHAQVFDNF